MALRVRRTAARRNQTRVQSKYAQMSPRWRCRVYLAELAKASMSKAPGLCGRNGKALHKKGNDKTAIWG